MAYKVGYWVDLNRLQLSEEDGDTSLTFQAIPLGKYDHPVHGEIDFTPEKIEQVVQNFNSNVRGTDLDIDYDHKAKTTEAAGWVKAAENRGKDGLWLTVDFTKDAYRKIKEKAFKYFSPEFTDEWAHPKTGTVHRNVLFGGALTNRPFLKDILPLNMSELFAEHQEEGTGGMDPKKLRKLLKLSEDATDEQVEEALQAAAEAADEDPDNPDNEGEPKDKDGDNPDEPAQPSVEQLSELGLTAEVIKRLSESTNPEVKVLTDLVTGLATQVSTTTAALALSETAAKVKKLSEPVEGKRQLPAATANKLQEILLQSPKELSDKIVELIDGLNKAGYVQLGETGRNTPDNPDGGDAVKRFNDEVTKVMEADKLGYADAVTRVAALNEDLYNNYREASYAFRN